MAKNDTQTGASAGPSADDFATLAAEVRALRDERGAQQQQMDSALDALIEARDEIDRLKRDGIGGAAVSERSTVEDDFNDELKALSEEFHDYPGIHVFEQRVLVGVDANTEIRLKDESSVLEDPQGDHRRWKLRWFNFAKEGRAQQAASEGYVKVRWDELSDQEAIVGARTDAYVRKGERGLEVLHKIPMKLYAYKKRRDAARHAGMLTSESGLRDMVANRVAGMANTTGGNADHAGSTVSKEFSVSITEGPKETITA